MPLAALIGFPRIQILRWFANGTFAFKLADFALQCRDQGLGDLVLKIEQVNKLATDSLSQFEGLSKAIDEKYMDNKFAPEYNRL